MGAKQDAIVAELERLRVAKGGELPPAYVLEEARDPSNPLHDQFDWDDTEAAQKHRLWQSRQLIKRYEIEYAPPGKVPELVKGYVSVRPTDTGPRTYVTVKTAVETPLYSNQMEERLARSLAVIHKQYSVLPNYKQILQDFIDGE